MGQPNRPKSNKNIKMREEQILAPLKGPKRTYSISKPWTPPGSTQGIGKAKARIHSIDRRLKSQKGDIKLPGHLRINLERELKALRSEVAINRAEEARFIIMQRDKRIKFFGKSRLK